MIPRGLVGKVGEHEILEETRSRLFVQRHVNPTRGVSGLLEEDGIASKFEDVDGDAETLAGEDGVHDGDVLVR